MATRHNSSMPRTRLSRDHRAKILTEPLTPQEWMDFSVGIHKEPEPEHLRFQGSWNFSLMQQAAHSLWKRNGQEGEIVPPGLINTTEDATTDNKINVEFDQAVLPSSPGSEILTEGRGRKRKMIDYSYSVFALGLDAEDYEAEEEKRGRRGLTLGFPSDPLDEGERVFTPKARKQEKQQPLLNEKESVQKRPYSGKRRGRPPKRPQSDGLHSDDVAKGTPLTSNLPVSSPAASQQLKRRRVFMNPEKQVQAIDLSERVSSAESEPPLGAPSHSPVTGPQDIIHGGMDEPAGVPLDLSSIFRTFQTTPSRALISPDRSHTEVLSSMGPPPSPRVTDPASPGDSSSGWATVYSDDEDTTPNPAGFLQLTDLHYGIKATIPPVPEYFSRRDHISRLIGGNTRSLWCPIGKPKPNAPIQTKGYVAIQPTWNPRAPKRAGENGSIMQLGDSGLDNITPLLPEFPVFVARGRNQWEYCGQYTMNKDSHSNTEFTDREREAYLPKRLVDYWGKQIIDKKFEWAKEVFMERGKVAERDWEEALQTQNAELATRMIEDGTIPMFWIHLQCVGFHRGLYDALVGEKVKGASVFIYIPPAEEP
ncbi:hypothetical protein H072_2652 [Dactylellina haptotyla CBS 200.50]|uniref:DUF6697 domain-containing protein n=1 Tax=Dactylellina haptotyla (strain CBS 200.50) TaxID=1284197 RepID=S8BVE1_DACHA|nr:hypothetical protein H072_2652 [Dactylellina haptotyla CBS 200.50]